MICGNSQFGIRCKLTFQNLRKIYPLSVRLPHLLLISSRNCLRSSSVMFIHLPLHGGPPKNGFLSSVFPSASCQFRFHFDGPLILPPKFPKSSRQSASKPTACQYLSGATWNTDGMMAFHNHMTAPPRSNAAARAKTGNMKKRLLYVFRWFIDCKVNN